MKTYSIFYRLTNESSFTTMARDHLSDDTTPIICPKPYKLLERVAEALSVPVEIFSNSGEHELDQMREMLSLWLMIDDERDRAKVLAFVQNAAAPKPLRIAAE